jgi:cobalt-zinc-cadmium efflux system membrane fusion protein
MFTTVTIYAPGEQPTVGVPKTALIYEGDQVRVWVANDDKTIELRTIKTGMTNAGLVEVFGNLRPGEKIVTRGSLFIDRVASAS